MQRDIIWDVRWCPHEGESDLFVSGSADHTARIWKVDTEAHTMSVLWSYSGHDGSVNTVRYHPIKNIICSSSGDRTCHIWKPSLSTSLKEYHSFHLRSLIRENDEEVPGHRSLLSESQIITKPLIKLIAHQGFVTTGEWSADGSQIFTGSQDATIKVWDMADASKPMFTFPGHDSTITSIACHPSNTNLFYSCRRNRSNSSQLRRIKRSECGTRAPRRIW